MAQARGVRRRELSQLPCGPLGYLISPNNFRNPEPEEREEERCATAALGSCCWEGQGGSWEGRDRRLGGSLCPRNPLKEANQ